MAVTLSPALPTVPKSTVIAIRGAVLPGGCEGELIRVIGVIFLGRKGGEGGGKAGGILPLFSRVEAWRISTKMLLATVSQAWSALPIRKIG